MSPLFEELDYQETPLGPLSLRRRRQLQLDVDVVEVILGEEHLMSDLFTASEEALARLALAEVTARAPRVLVGGLGLGYTAAAALD
ncbi:MAG: spermidine synthase, partial [Pseudomonadota bacterium]|nr:spermidine synthase [Pseudomonadota bacterium]